MRFAKRYWANFRPGIFDNGPAVNRKVLEMAVEKIRVRLYVVSERVVVGEFFNSTPYYMPSLEWERYFIVVACMCSNGCARRIEWVVEYVTNVDLYAGASHSWEWCTRCRGACCVKEKRLSFSWLCMEGVLGESNPYEPHSDVELMLYLPIWVAGVCVTVVSM